VDFKDWETFRKDYRQALFGDEKAQKNRFLFRGHADAAWHLESGFDRWYTKSDLPSGRRSAVFKEIVSLFRAELLNSADYREIEHFDEHELIALGQHFGLPTRLLDWSRSLYIGAYFAFSGVLFEDIKAKKVAIWAVDTTSDIWTAELGAQIVQISAKSNARLRNQEGCFTLLNSLKNTLEDFVEEAARPSETLLWKLTLPSTCAREAINDLDFIGFGARRLFPDFQGYARSAFTKLVTMGADK